MRAATFVDVYRFRISASTAASRSILAGPSVIKTSNLIDMAERLSTGRDAVVMQAGAGGSGVTSEAPPTPSALPAAGPPH